MAKKYNKIEAKDNMNVKKADENLEEVAVEEKVQVSKVVSKEPKKVKKSLAGRLVSGLVGPDGLPGIGTYVNEEIVKPAIKNIIVEAVTSGINMVMYGDKGTPRGSHVPRVGSRGVHRPHTDYRRASTDTQPERERVPARAARQGYTDYVIDDRTEASDVLVSLTEYADRYDTVSVADYYDMIGVPSKYTDHNYGWGIDSITRATIVPARGGGYIIKFPPVEVIK